MKTVRINRKKWLRGNFGSELWDLTEDAGCCLGHVCIQINRKSKKQLHMHYSPEEVFLRGSTLTQVKNGCVKNNDFVEEAIHFNDHTRFSEEERESKLIQLFKKNDIKLEFYN